MENAVGLLERLADRHCLSSKNSFARCHPEQSRPWPGKPPVSPEADGLLDRRYGTEQKSLAKAKAAELLVMKAPS